MAKIAILFSGFLLLTAVKCHAGYYSSTPSSASNPGYYGAAPSASNPPGPSNPGYYGAAPSASNPPGPGNPGYYGAAPSASNPPGPSNPGYYGSAPSTSNPPSPSNGYGLRVGYYDRKCPHAEYIIRYIVGKALAQEAGLGAGIIRMLFHDCFVEGCDASVLLDPTPANPQPEKLGPPNFPSLRGFEVIDAAKDALEHVCPMVVSCADIIAFAARDASFFLSNRRVDFKMPAGRLDGRKSLASETLQFLPPPSFNLTELRDSFAVKGLDTSDLVTLSGSHTVGRSHCSSFTDRLSSPSDINGSLAAFLRGQCPTNPTPSNDPSVMQDILTPDSLDNQYYKNVLSHRVLFNSDATLLTSRRTTRMVIANAFVPGRWEKKFKKAMVKMAGIEVKTGNNGEIRRKCRVVN